MELLIATSKKRTHHVFSIDSGREQGSTVSTSKGLWFAMDRTHHNRREESRWTRNPSNQREITSVTRLKRSAGGGGVTESDPIPERQCHWSRRRHQMLMPSAPEPSPNVRAYITNPFSPPPPLAMILESKAIHLVRCRHLGGQRETVQIQTADTQVRPHIAHSARRHAMP